MALPWLAPLYTLSKYDMTMRDDVLPLVLGLTGDAGYAEGVAILAALALTRRTRPATAAAAAVLLRARRDLALAPRAWTVFSLDALQANLAGLREYFFSQRLLQWVPLAGLIAVARRSVPLALALGGWLGGYVAFRLTSATTFEEGGSSGSCSRRSPPSCC